MKSTLACAALLLSALSSVTAAPANGTAIAKRQCPPTSSSASPPPASSTSVAPPAQNSTSGGGGSSSGSGPIFSVYADKYLSQSAFPTGDDLKGWNVFILAFWLLEGPADNAIGWTQFDAPTRASLKKSLNDAGILLMVSAFGSTDVPTTSGADPVGTANKLAAFVTQYGFDGVDVDYEDLGAFDAGTGAEKWLITFTTTLRAALPSPQYKISHAPLAPWFQPGTRWPGGGYLAVDKAVGSMIDWYNIQFYNQGVTEYTTCDGLFTQSSSAWPQTSVFEMISNGVDASKIVVGKPGNTGDASNGFIDPGTLAGCVSDALGKGWNGGVMSWEYPDANAAWIQQVRGTAWPV